LTLELKFTTVNFDVTDQRKAIRFDLKLPVELIRSGVAPEPRIAETRNMSSNGVLFIADVAVPVGETIEYFITLPVGQAPRQVRLRCMGKVVRHDGSNGTAATLERYEFVRN
jgi:hypothetical protein